MRYKKASDPNTTSNAMRRTKDRAILLAIIVIMIAFVLTACKGKGQGSNPPADVAKTLASMDGVISVETIDNNRSDWMPEKFIVTFEQQLDWNDPSAGVFPQRVEIGLHPGADVTVMDTNGYMLVDMQLRMNDQPEVCEILNANYVKIEHRFMGESYPEGMTTDKPEGWEYATIENEAGDCHRIYTALSEAMGGKWICYGRSRGGRACLDYVRLYPEDDIKGCIPYVGVNCYDDSDPRMTDFLYMSVGDLAYGEEEGAAIRKAVLDFQVELMRKKDDLSGLLWDWMERTDMPYFEGMTESRLYDMTVFEFLAGFWMDSGTREEIEKVLEMPEASEEEKSQKLSSELILLMRHGDPSTYSYKHYTWPFYATALKGEGMYGYDFAVLRQRLEEEGLQDKLEVTAEDEHDYLRNFVLSEAQQEVFRYTPGHYEALDEWAKTTDTNVIFIGGDLDPWSSVYVDGGDNPHFKKYIRSGKSHFVNIADFDKEVQDEITSTMKSWVA